MTVNPTMTFVEAMVFTRRWSSHAAFEDQECQLLFELVKWIPEDGTIIEIGSQYGRSSSIILQAAPEDAELIFIDPFVDPVSAVKWMEMARETERHFTLYVKKSEEIWDPLFFNLILIDGDHTKAGVEQDLDMLDYAFPGAYACFHDWGRDSLPEIYPTVNAYMLEHSEEWKFFQCAGTLGVWRRK